ncbi:MAG: GTPase RsgA, partial [Pseudomonadota bacterium]
MHRSRVELLGESVPAELPLPTSAIEDGITVGDWVAVDPGRERIVAVLDRIGAFKRRAAGVESKTQLIAANVDTLFIVTSANRDFNAARLERYLAIAREAGAFPVIVISKADTVDDVRDYVNEASRLAPGMVVEALDARDPDAVSVLASWCGEGQTVALVGSSGVGKSTL